MNVTVKIFKKNEEFSNFAIKIFIFIVYCNANILKLKVD